MLFLGLVLVMGSVLVLVLALFPLVGALNCVLFLVLIAVAAADSGLRRLPAALPNDRTVRHGIGIEADVMPPIDELSRLLDNRSILL